MPQPVEKPCAQVARRSAAEQAEHRKIDRVLALVQKYFLTETPKDTIGQKGSAGTSTKLIKRRPSTLANLSGTSENNH